MASQIYGRYSSIREAVGLGLLKEDPTRLNFQQQQLLQKYSWLSPSEVQILLQLAMIGEGGLAARTALKLAAKSAEGLLRVEACGLTAWEHDARGRPAYLVLSSKGDELAAAIVLANHPSNQASL